MPSASYSIDSESIRAQGIKIIVNKGNVVQGFKGILSTIIIIYLCYYYYYYYYYYYVILSSSFSGDSHVSAAIPQLRDITLSAIGSPKDGWQLCTSKNIWETQPPIPGLCIPWDSSKCTNHDGYYYYYYYYRANGLEWNRSLFDRECLSYDGRCWSKECVLL